MMNIDIQKIKKKIQRLNKKYPIDLINYAPYDNWVDFTKDYIKDLKRLNKNGGEVVRFLFIGKNGSINKKNLGDHYTIYDDYLFKGGIKSNNRFKHVYSTLLDDLKMRDEILNKMQKPIKLYAIICKISSNSIDFNESISEFEHFPNEKEVQLKSNVNIKIMNTKLLRKSVL